METPKLEWMYRNANETVDHEEYLLGRPVDKAFEQSTLGNEIEKDCLPTPIFSNTNSSIQVDVIRKLKEDPLEIIRQQEIERRKQLLKNPVKLKKLQNMLKAKQEEEDCGITKKKKKKKKKSVSSADEDAQDLDSLLASKYLKLMKKHGIKSLSDLSSLKVKKQKNKKKKSDSSSEDSDESSESEAERPIKRKKKKSYSCGSSESERDTKKYASNKSDLSKTEGKSMKNRCRDELYEPKSSDKCTSKQKKEKNEKGNHKYKIKELDTSESDSQSDLSNKNKYGLDRMGKKYDKEHKKSRNRRSRSSSIEHKQTALKDNKPKDSGGARKYDSSIKRNYNKPKSNYLSEKEKQKKLQEMMENAKWRDEVRVKNVNRYKKEEAEEKNGSGKEYNDDFYRKQMAIAASSGSVESRIKSNINNIQRSKFSMDQNFARR